MRQKNQRLTREEKDALKNRIFDQLGLPQSEEMPSVAAGRFSAVMFRRVATAAVVIAITLPLLFLIGKNTKPQAAAALAKTVVKTAAGEIRRVLLPDSSVVLLNASSALTWRTDFLADSSREVALEGNAFFSVRKRPAQARFTVHTRSLAISVLGTEFNVNARTAAAEVALVRGKVDVSRTGGTAGTILHPGEQVKFDPARSELVRTAMNSALYSAWTENRWNFNRTRLEDILSLVQAYYGVNPVFEKSERKELKITASITVGRLEDLVSIIENTLQIRIKIENNELLVK